MKSIITIAALCLLSYSASAHHSVAHYAQESSELEGEITRVQWRNPHIMFTLKVTDDNGEERLVRMESGSIYYLERAGFTKDTLKVGDKVTAGGKLSTRRNTDFLLNKITRASGEVLPLSRDDLQAAFKDEQIDTTTENKNIFRVWGVPANNKRERFTSLNALAEEKKAEFDPLDNFSVRCEDAGMPRIMWYPHPYEFVDLGDAIQLNIEIYNQVRTIHMNQSETPDDFAGSPLGYSVGHWQDERTLVVKTTGMNWGVYVNDGTPLSEEADVIETFTLSEDQSRLDFHIETNDPVYFNEPAIISAHWIAVDDEVEPYECFAM